MRDQALPPRSAPNPSCREVRMRPFLLLLLCLALTLLALAGNPTTMSAADERETGCPGNSVDDWIKRLKDDPDSIDRAKAAIRLRSFDDQLE